MSEKKTPADYVVERDGFAEVTLSRPAKINGVETAVLKLREPTAGDLERFQESKGSDARREVEAFANLCEASPDDIRNLPVRDYSRLQAGYALFTT